MSHFCARKWQSYLKHHILFDLTIRRKRHVRINARDMSDAQIEKASQTRRNPRFHHKSSQGYDTSIGDCGSTLSGGQAQRIALARALVRNPQILILDECTSGLDPESSRLVERAVRGLVQEGGRTTLIITHKENMIRVADRVIVLKNGEIVEGERSRSFVHFEGELWNILQSGWAG